MTSKEHLLHYLILFLILTLGLVGFVVFRFHPPTQLLIVGLTVAGYIGWGIVHHYIEGRLRWEVVGEYFLISALVFVMFALTLLR
jgi:nitric oxide reductase large subunit